MYHLLLHSIIVLGSKAFFGEGQELGDIYKNITWFSMKSVELDTLAAQHSISYLLALSIPCAVFTVSDNRGTKVLE